jgi:DNA-binding phage protein
MANKKVVREALIDALMHDDLDAFRDVFVSYVRYTSKSKLAKKSGLGRQTLYDIMDRSKEFNPNFKTIGAILESLAA